MAACESLGAKLKHRLTLQSKVRTTDGQGGYTEAWSHVADLWAFIEPSKGYERIYAMQAQTPITHRVTIRYRAGITTAMRLLYGSRVFEIKEIINPEEANVSLRLLCLETQ